VHGASGSESDVLIHTHRTCFCGSGYHQGAGPTTPLVLGPMSSTHIHRTCFCGSALSSTSRADHSFGPESDVLTHTRCTCFCGSALSSRANQGVVCPFGKSSDSCRVGGIPSEGVEGYICSRDSSQSWPVRWFQPSEKKTSNIFEFEEGELQMDTRLDLKAEEFAHEMHKRMNEVRSTFCILRCCLIPLLFLFYTFRHPVYPHTLKRSRKNMQPNLLNTLLYVPWSQWKHGGETLSPKRFVGCAVISLFVKAQPVAVIRA